MDKQISYERYHRQLILQGFGEEAQKKLLQAKVLVIGAGGLGCPALQYLTAAGVGMIGVVDNDVVDLSNLHRQILFNINDIGFSKAERAIATLKRINPELDLIAHNTMITAGNAPEIIKDYDIVLDGSDNFPTRYLVNDTCVLLNKPFVYGAVSQYEGQVAIFNCSKNFDRRPVNYRDLFPQPPADNEILNCEEAGVLGVLPGIIGTMMANETIKLITGVGTPLIDKLVTYDARNNQLYEIELTAREETREMIPPDLLALKKMDYQVFCSAGGEFEIDIESFNELLQSGTVDVIDVREESELPKIEQFEHRSIPMGELQTFNGDLKNNTIVVFCQTGKRSLQAARELNKKFNSSKKVFSLRGGIGQWLKQHVVQ